MTQPERWSQVLNIAGGVAVFVGAIDPLEGSALILPGSGLLALGSYLGHSEERTRRYRTWGFVLIAFGVAALFGLSALGGIGGPSGHSVWWALLVLPYLVGWSIDVWGPGMPKWHMLAGVVVGLWWVALFALVLRRAANAAHSPSVVPGVVIGIVGLATITACAARLARGAST